MRRTSHIRARTAFSVIELLTVITIIGILASILIPVLGNMRSSARTAQCVGNLRQIGAAMALYSEDNRHHLPAVGSSLASEPIYWHVALHKYTGADFPVSGGEPQENIVNPIFTCPDWYDARTDESFPDIGYAYALMHRGTGNDFARKTAYPTLHDPSRTILVAEHSVYYFDPKASLGGALLSDPKPKNSLRHGTQANYLFADGHVASLNPDEARVYFPGSP